MNTIHFTNFIHNHNSAYCQLRLLSQIVPGPLNVILSEFDCNRQFQVSAQCEFGSGETWARNNAKNITFGVENSELPDWWK